MASSTQVGRALLSVLWQYVEPLDMAACACTCKHLATILAQARVWQHVYALRWPQCEDRERDVAQWRALAIERGILDAEARLSFVEDVGQLLAVCRDNEEQFLKRLQANAQLRKAQNIFHAWFGGGLLPGMALRFVALEYHDGGSGGISGSCSIQLTALIALYMKHSAAPLYFLHTYSASGYNDDPQFSGALEVSVNLKALRRKLGRHPEGFRSRWLARAKAAAAADAPRSQYAPPRGNAAASAALPLFADGTKPATVLTIESEDSRRSHLRRSATGLASSSSNSVHRNLQQLFAVLGPCPGVPMQPARPAQQGRPFAHKRSKQHSGDVMLVEVVLRFAEAVRELNEGLSFPTNDALKSALVRACNSDLLEAVIQGSVSSVQQLVGTGDVNFMSPVTRLTPLLAAFARKNSNGRGHFSREIVHALIAAGADVNARMPDTQSTVLHLLAEGEQDAAVLAELLAAGAELEAVNAKGHTPFTAACVAQNLVVAKALAEAGAQFATNAQLFHDMFGDTQAWGSVQPDVELIRFLLQRGVPMDETLGSVLYRVIDPNALEMLIQGGANVNHPSCPLKRAVEMASLPVVRALLLHGANPSVPGVLHRAIVAATGGHHARRALTNGEGDDAQIALELIAAGCDVNVAFGGGTPLHLCAQGDCAKLVPVLVARGADVNAVAADGKQPIDMALSCRDGAPLTVEALVTAGAQYNIHHVQRVSLVHAKLARPMYAHVCGAQAALQLPDNLWAVACHFVATGAIVDLKPEKFRLSADPVDAERLPIHWTDEDVQALCSAMQSPTCKLVALDLGYHPVSDKGGAALAEALPHCHTLTSLNLIGCKHMTATGYRSIIAALKHSPHIKSCSLVFVDGPRGLFYGSNKADDSWKVDIEREAAEAMGPRLGQEAAAVWLDLDAAE